MKVTLLRSIKNKYIAIFGLLLGSFVISFAGAASASGTVLKVDPSTGLTNGQTVTVSGSGFADNAPGTIIECSNVPNQPTVQVLSGYPAADVSCTSPLNYIESTTSTGVLESQSFTVNTGVVGPPAQGTDSNGNPASSDAQAYPCPPTAAQLAEGYSCDVTFGYFSGGKEYLTPHNVVFAGQIAPTKTNLRESANRLVYGSEQREKVTATVTPFSASGIVVIDAGSRHVCTIHLNVATKTNVSGSYIFIPRQLPVGAYSLVAKYAGTSGFAASRSPGLRLTVVK